MKIRCVKILLTFLCLAMLYIMICKNPGMKNLRRNKIFAEYLDIATVFKSKRSFTRPINVMTIMTSLKDTKSFPLQLKSILYHRSSPVVLHLFVTSDIQKRIISTLLSTWSADKVHYQIYLLNESIKQPTLSVIYGTFKDFLFPFAKKVVYISPKIIFTSDVTEWFSKCEGDIECSNILVEDLPCGDDSSKNNCAEIPHMAFLNFEGFQYLADKNSANVKLLPCQLVPLSSHILRNDSMKCYEYFSNIKSSAVHSIQQDFQNDILFEENILNLMNELVRTIDASEPRNRLYMPSSRGIFELKSNGSINNRSYKSLIPQFEDRPIFELKNPNNSSMNQSTPPKKDSIEEFCDYLVKMAHIKRMTHIFYHYGEKIKKMDDQGDNVIEVTLLTVLTLDRLGSLEKMLNHWPGPAAVLFYLSVSEASYELPKLLSTSTVLKVKKVLERIAIHLVYKTSTYNPINYLRNVLLNNTLTKYNIYIDIDLIPNPGFYDNVKKALKESDPKIKDRLFMIPAFEALVPLEKNLPKDKDKLLELIGNGTVSGYEVGVKNAPGHKSTNYEKWMKSDTIYEASYVKFFEPYVITPRKLTARFNENLLERMQDKVAYVRTLKAMDFKFFVLPEDFIIHLPHPVSYGRRVLHSDPRFHRCDKIINQKHREMLVKIYPKAKI